LGEILAVLVREAFIAKEGEERPPPPLRELIECRVAAAAEGGHELFVAAFVVLPIHALSPHFPERGFHYPSTGTARPSAFFAHEDARYAMRDTRYEMQDTK